MKAGRTISPAHLNTPQTFKTLSDESRVTNSRPPSSVDTRGSAMMRLAPIRIMRTSTNGQFASPVRATWYERYRCATVSHCAEEPKYETSFDICTLANSRSEPSAESCASFRAMSKKKAESRGSACAHARDRCLPTRSLERLRPAPFDEAIAPEPKLATRTTVFINQCTRILPAQCSSDDQRGSEKSPAAWRGGRQTHDAGPS
jgi:hypothetical protein